MLTILPLYCCVLAFCLPRFDFPSIRNQRTNKEIYQQGLGYNAPLLIIMFTQAAERDGVEDRATGVKKKSKE